jgi:hypothetical protein
VLLSDMRNLVSREKTGLSASGNMICNFYILFLNTCYEGVSCLLNNRKYSVTYPSDQDAGLDR